MLLVLFACTRHVDEPCGSFWVDRDGDSYGSAESACSAGPGVVENSDDCADDDPLIHPGAVDACDGVDDDCDGGDGDIGAEEVCGDGIDSDCDALDPPCPFSGEYDLADATARLTCSTAGWQAGLLVETGDVDADGAGDILVSTVGVGGGFLVPGPVTADAALEDVAYRISSSDETWGASRSISLGDVNGDEFADVGFGVPWAEANGLYVLFGPVTGDRAVIDAELALVGTEGTYCGHGADLADVNDDGFGDAVIGAFEDASEVVGGGKLYVQWGPLSGGEVHLTTGIVGMVEGRRPGRAIRAGRDVNGDGIGDIVMNMVFDDGGGMSAGACS